MNTTREERIEALKKSIRHWEEDWKGLDFEEPGGALHLEDFGGQNCPLCALHHNYNRGYKHHNECGECPLIDEWGMGCDEGSPYVDANRAYRKANKEGFLKAKDEILDRMRAALEEER